MDIMKKKTGKASSSKGRYIFNYMYLFIIKKTIRYAYGPKKLSEMVRKKPPMI